jgi:uncharacterized BrkB/YihY/UPF0761 family membrane protein
MLPFSLVLAVVFGWWRDLDPNSLEEVAGKFGLTAVITSTVSDAAHTSNTNRWILIPLGLVLLFWFTYGLVRAARLVSTTAWDVPYTRMTHAPRVVATTLGVIVGVWATALVAAYVREWSGGIGLVTTVIVVAAYAAAGLLAFSYLPHRPAPWTALLPGAILFALGMEAVHLFTVYYLVEKIGRSSALYGSLGTAAVLLLWLYVVGRLFVAAIMLNATLWTRDHPSSSD